MIGKTAVRCYRCGTNKFPSYDPACYEPAKYKGLRISVKTSKPHLWRKYLYSFVDKKWRRI